MPVRVLTCTARLRYILDLKLCITAVFCICYLLESLPHRGGYYVLCITFKYFRILCIIYWMLFYIYCSYESALTYDNLLNVCFAPFNIYLLRL
ncbi:hypothetical protein PDJAM_G00053790 [Pangasius djambal]|uniref:Uncharacterized protein n=1 Tax=Pangasius djambal TaxID=1691987 RepID=A0ACC5YVY0_9TELE|nr:hypothetical protein [Pangasius djambal]